MSMKSKNKVEIKVKKLKLKTLTEIETNVYNLIVENWDKIVQLSLKREKMALTTIINSQRPGKTHIWEIIKDKINLTKDQLEDIIKNISVKTEEDHNLVARVISLDSHLRLGYIGVKDLLKYHKNKNPSLDIDKIWKKINMTTEGKLVMKRRRRKKDGKELLKIDQTNSKKPMLKVKKDLVIEKNNKKKSIKLKKDINEADKQEIEIKKQEVTISDNILTILDKSYSKITKEEFFHICGVVVKNLSNRAVKIVTPTDVIKEGEKIIPDFAKIFTRLFLQDTEASIWLCLRAESFVIDKTMYQQFQS